MFITIRLVQHKYFLNTFSGVSNMYSLQVYLRNSMKKYIFRRTVSK